MSVYDDELAALTRTPQAILTLAVPYCANHFTKNIEQYLRFTDDFTSVHWVKSGVTVTGDNAVARDGSKTADLLTFAAVADNIAQTDVVTIDTGKPYLGSVWLKSPSSDGTISIAVTDNANTGTEIVVNVLASDWTRLWVDNTFGGGTTVRFRIIRRAGDLAAVLAWRPNLYLNPYASPKVHFPTRKRVDEALADVFVHVSRCQATDPGSGSRCFYAEPTCLDKAGLNGGNLWETELQLRGLREYKFCLSDYPLPLGGSENIRPMLLSHSQAPQEVIAEESITRNERTTYRLMDDNGPTLGNEDKAAEGALVNPASTTGTFFRRWLARHRNYTNPRGYARLTVGFVASGMTEALFEQRAKGPMSNLKLLSGGVIEIEATDILKLARKEIPSKISDSNTLQVQIDASATTLMVADASEYTPPAINAAEAQSEGTPDYFVVLRVGTEKMNLIARDLTAGSLTVQRGRWGTSASAHFAGDMVEEIAEFGTERATPSATPLGKNRMDCVRELLMAAGLMDSQVDWTSLAAQRDLWDPTTIDTTTGAQSTGTVRATIEESTAIEDLLTELRDSMSPPLLLYVTESQTVSGKILGPPSPTDTVITLTADDIVAEDGISSLTVDDNLEDSLFTTALVAYDLEPGQDHEEILSYNQGIASVDSVAEADTGRGERRLRKILSRWIRPGDVIAARALVGRLASRFKDGARLATWRMELRDDKRIQIGTYVQFTHELFQDPAGSTATPRTFVIIRKQRLGEGLFEVRAVDTNIFGRFFWIGPNSLPDYGSATDAEKNYGFIGDTQNRVGALKEDGYYIP